jgi:hypothetical protein
VRYVAFIFDSNAEPVSVDVPRAVLSGSRVVEGATAKANAPGSFDAAVCVLDLETRQVVALMRRLKAASLGVLAAADEEKGPELLARAARFELFLRLQEKLKGTTVPCLRAKRAGTTIDLCKPGEPAGLPLIRVNKQDCAVSDGRCSQYVDTAGRLVLAGPYALGTEFSEGVALTGGQGRCALIDRMGQERCQLECVDIRDASEGLFRVQAADETCARRSWGPSRTPSPSARAWRRCATRMAVHASSTVRARPSSSPGSTGSFPSGMGSPVSGSTGWKSCSAS